MERKFNIGDIVMLKDIGVRCMKVIDTSDDFDEDAKSHLLGHLFKILDEDVKKDIDKDADNEFNESEHMIYYATCEWCDDNGVLHKDTFEENKLDYCKGLPPRNVIEGFRQKQ